MRNICGRVPNYTFLSQPRLLAVKTNYLKIGCHLCTVLMNEIHVLLIFNIIVAKGGG